MSLRLNRDVVKGAAVTLGFTTVLAAPFGVSDGGWAAASSPMVVCVALGIWAGALVSLLMEAHGARDSRIVLASSVCCLGLGALYTVPSWIAAVCYRSLAYDDGFFGTSAYVDLLVHIESVRPIALFAMGVAIALLFRGGGSRAGEFGRAESGQDGPFKKQLPSLYCVLSFAAALACCSIRTCVMAHSDEVPLPSALLTATCCFAVISILYLDSYRLGLRDSGSALGQRSAEQALSCFALGIFVWGALLRVVDVHILSSLRVSLVVFLLFVAMAMALRRFSRYREKEPEIPEHERLATLLEPYGLAPRELEITLQTLDGRSSSEVAVACGIKPATVRSALQRVYRKAGVGSRGELYALLGVEDARESVKSKDLSAAPHDGAVGGCAAQLKMERAEIVLFCIWTGALLVPVLSVSGAWGAARLPIYILSIVFLMAGAFGEVCLTMQRRCDVPSISARLRVDFQIIVFCCLLGFAWEEGWRNAGGYPLREFTAPFEVFGIVCMCLTAWHMRLVSERFALLACIVVGALLLVLGRIGLVIAAALVTCWFMQSAVRRNLLPADILCLGLASFGFSAIASDVLVNKCADMVWGNDWFTRAFGGRIDFALLACLIALLALCLASVMFAMACAEVRSTWSVRLWTADGFDPFERVRHYLLGRGLNRAQSDVLTEIVRGRTSGQISGVLSYSRGTVHSARDAGYSMLGVHSRWELIKLLSQHIGL